MPKSIVTDLDFGGVAKATGLTTPTAASDAATKAYVDAVTLSDVAGSTDLSWDDTGKSLVVLSNGTNPAVRITQTGTGPALRVEDEANPDATPFLVGTDGRVSIGTATPATQVPLTTLADTTSGAALTVRGRASDSTSIIRFNDNADALRAVIQSATAALTVGSQNNGNLIFQTNATDRMNILGTGAHVGIGRAPVDNTTFTSLSLDGTSGAIMDFYANGALRGRSFAGTGSMAFAASGASTFLRFDTNATERLRFEANGAWGLGGANYGTSGQVLTSNGSAAAPTWTTVSGGGPITTITFPEQGTEPAAPAADNGTLYAFDEGGRTMPVWRNPLDNSYPLASHEFFNNQAYWRGGNGATATSLSVIGTMPYTAVATTTTTPALATTNIFTQSIRSRYTTNTTVGNVSSVRTNTPMIHRGSVAGLGGFHAGLRFGYFTLTTAYAAFHGLWSGTTNPGNVNYLTDTATGRIGLVSSANSGNLQLAHNTQGTAPTLINLGATMPVNTTDMYELLLYCGPNASSVSYKVTNMNTAAVVTGTISTNLPANTQFLGLMSTMVSTNGVAVAYDFVAGFVESNT